MFLSNTKYNNIAIRLMIIHMEKCKKKMIVLRVKLYFKHITFISLKSRERIINMSHSIKIDEQNQ
jgi:hypothetical protein